MHKFQYILCFIISLTNATSQALFQSGSYFKEFERTNTSSFPEFQDLSLHSKDSIINTRLYKSNPDTNNWLIRKIRYEHFISVRETHFELNISPLFILDMERENQKETFFRNTRGVMLEVTLDKHIGFYSTFHENQSGFMEHVSLFADYFGVVPGQGFHKPFKNKSYDYAWSEGMIVYQPIQNLNIQYGHGKRFIGNGYRSMLYSDNTFSYPHLYVNYRIHKFRYNTWFTSFMNPDIPEPKITLNHHWQRKAGVFHYLTYQPLSQLEFSFFEGNIMKSRDQIGKYHFDIRQYNPLILLNSLNKHSNNYLGFNLQYYKLGFNCFGQYVLNPQQTGRHGWQAGTSYRHWFPYSFILVHAEIDHASKDLYTFSDSIISYSHYNQSLAHPLGENFTEYIFRTNIRIRSVELEYKFNYSKSYSDSSGYLTGLNLFLTQEDRLVLPYPSNRHIHEFKLSYIINPQYNMRLTVGIFVRNFSYNNYADQTTYYYISFQTPIFNRYYDF